MKLINLPDTGIFINPDNILYIAKPVIDNDQPEVPLTSVEVSMGITSNTEYIVKFVGTDTDLTITKSDMIALMASGASEWNP